MSTQPNFLDTLRREAGAAIQAITGIPAGLKEAFTAPATPEENQEFNGDAGKSLGHIGLGLYRSTLQPLNNAIQDYSHGKVNADNALSVAPEAIGTAGGATIGGKLLDRLLPGEHPEVAKQALQEHVSTGGSTIDARTGQSLAGSRHYTVGVSPETAQHTLAAPTPDQYSQFVSAHKDILAQHPNTAIGTSYDPATGLHKMELVGTTTSKSAAGSLASHLGEDHVYHLGTDTKVPTGFTGEWQPSPLDVRGRLKQLADQTPPKETYSGTHFSDSKMDVIDGARRGNSGLSAENMRIRLGTQTGMGEDAPAGFHTYQSGSLPDPVMAAKKNAYQVRGRLAFASTDHPAFQNGYAEGVQRATQAGADPKTAHQLGLNAAERAVQDAGFDGYYSPKHPNMRFHFGSEPAVPVAPKTAPELDWGKPYGPPKADFGGEVPKENLGFDFTPPKDYGNAVRADVERRMGGPLPRGQVERRGGAPGGITPNGSAPGPSGADSIEAINRVNSEKIKGIKRFARDTRSGFEKPLFGVDAVDYQPQPHEVVIQRGPEGDVELGRGAMARR